MTKIAKQTEPDESQILGDIDSENVRLVAGQHQIDVLQSRRRSLLAAGDVDGVVEIDEKIGRASVTVEIAEAKIVGLEAELEARYAAAREAQTAADLAVAKGLDDEEREVCSSYEQHARAVAEDLAKLRDIAARRRTINLRLLPLGLASTSVHRGGVCETARLPGISTDRDFWPPSMRAASLDQVYGRVG